MCPDCDCDSDCESIAFPECDTRHLSFRDGIAHAFSHVYAELDPEPHRFQCNPDPYSLSEPDPCPNCYPG